MEGLQLIVFSLFYEIACVDAVSHTKQFTTVVLRHLKKLIVIIII